MLFYLMLGVSIIQLIILMFILILNSKHSNLIRNIEEIKSNTISNLREELRIAREESGRISQQLRQEIITLQNSNAKTLVTTISEMGKSQNTSLESVTKEIKALNLSNENRLEKLRQTVDDKLTRLQENNEKKLDEMRLTVDEKLHNTLEKRLGESFKLVNQQLEAVQLGLGEMRSLATGVGDLKKVLSNVKTRGTFGEVQLGAILEEILSSEQFEKNVRIRETSREIVEYAVRLPGASNEVGECIYLPIDSKFPQEDYQRLVDASEIGDIDNIKNFKNSLANNIKKNAKDIQTKYIVPPNTTDFAIMFLPTEGLYAEVLKYPGLVDELIRNYHIVVAGPTTLAAILSSLRMGFKTLAIEKRSSEVWKILGAVKTEFSKYGIVLDKLKSQLATASKTVEETGKRTRAMERKLSDVEKLPENETSKLLNITEKFISNEEVESN